MEQGGRKNHTKEGSNKHRTEREGSKGTTRMTIDNSFHFVFGIEIDPLKQDCQVMKTLGMAALSSQENTVHGPCIRRDKG